MTATLTLLAHAALLTQTAGVTQAGEAYAPVEVAATGPNLTTALVIGALFGAGTFLVMQRALTRVVIGLGLITHSGNLLLIAAGGHAGPAAFVADDGSLPDAVVDPLPQAMVLTAIVIAFAVSCLLLALSYRSLVLTRTDVVQDDPEDRRIARVHEEEGTLPPEYPSDFTPEKLAQIRAQERQRR